MKRNFVRAGAIAGVAALATLVAGPTMAATAPVSQATAEGLNLSIAGNKTITGTTTAVNDGTVASPGTLSTTSTLPQLAGLTPQTNIAGLGVVLQDAVANPDGTSSACAGLVGQGGGLVQVGTQPCGFNGGSATSLSLASLNLGNLVANPTSVVGQVVAALGINNVAGQLQGALVGPLTTGLANTLGQVALNGSLGVVEGHCQASPGAASGGASIANSNIGITLGNQTLTLTDLPANPPPNTHVLTDLSKVTQVVLNAVDTQVNNMLNTQQSQATGPAGTLTAQLGTLLNGVAPVTGTVGQLLTQVTGVAQNQIITQLNQQLMPLLQPLQQNILDITLNKQPVPQAAGTFETTALDAQVLPAAAQFTGSSLISGIIGHVKCGPNRAPNATTGATTAGPTTGNPTTGALPKHVSSGKGGAAQSIMLVGSSALLAATGGLGLMAYRRYWMPRG